MAGIPDNVSVSLCCWTTVRVLMLMLCRELFSSLLGQRVQVDEDDDDEAVDEDMVLDDGLRLFG
jgi:hypothetical protein